MRGSKWLAGLAVVALTLASPGAVSAEDSAACPSTTVAS
jgi:hypothetical protein